MLSWFCKHDYVKFVEKIIESEEPVVDYFGIYRYVNIKKNQKHIIIFKCNKCGKLQKFVTRI